MVVALIVGIEVLALVAIVGRISSVGVFGTSAGTPWLDLEIRPLVSNQVPAIIGFWAGAAIVADGYWLARRVSAENLGVKGVALLSLIALVAASVFVFGLRVTQSPERRLRYRRVAGSTSLPQ